MSNAPLVSIIVPSFNQGRFIRETLESVLSQSHRPIEVLVMDGGSTDETVDVLRSYPAGGEVSWWSERDRGVADAVNKGLEKARGEILAVQSSDDTYLPGAVEAAVATFEGGVGLVYGDVEIIDAASRVTGHPVQPPWSLEDFVGKRVYVPQPAAFFTREAARVTGGWREEFSYAADAEFFLRIAMRFGVRKIDRALARYRHHDDQRDKAALRVASDWEKAVRHWLGEFLPGPGLRRAALAGIHLTHVRYLPEERWWARTRHLYGALLHTPERVTDPAFPRRELLPGRYPIWRALSRVKRALGLAPRG